VSFFHGVTITKVFLNLILTPSTSGFVESWHPRGQIQNIRNQKGVKGKEERRREEVGGDIRKEVMICLIKGGWEQRKCFSMVQGLFKRFFFFFFL
jgi:hypothetical protein